MTLSTVEGVGDDFLQHGSLVRPDGTVADQPCVNLPARKSRQPGTVHRTTLSPGKKVAGEVDCEVVGGGIWPEKSRGGCHQQPVCS